MSHTPRPRVQAQVLEAGPQLGEIRILHAGSELVLELDRRLELIRPGNFPMLGEPALVQIEPGQPNRPCE